jgi:hypothetical protein
MVAKPVQTFPPVLVVNASHKLLTSTLQDHNQVTGCRKVSKGPMQCCIAHTHGPVPGHDRHWCSYSERVQTAGLTLFLSSSSSGSGMGVLLALVRRAWATTALLCSEPSCRLRGAAAGPLQLPGATCLLHPALLPFWLRWPRPSISPLRTGQREGCAVPLLS